jgi:Repeat of unknown function (DUF5648)
MAVKKIFLAITLLLIFSVVLGCRKRCQCAPTVEAVPVYRYWNGVEHFYTVNADEIGTTVAGQKGRHGYTSEGIAFYAPPTAAPQAQPTLKPEVQTPAPQAIPAVVLQNPTGNFKIVHRGGQVLNIWGGVANSLTQVKLYPWENSRNEIWRWNGSTIESVLAPGMVMNVRGGLAKDHDLIVYPITRVANDQFIYKDGALTASGFCLTTKGQTATGSVVYAAAIDSSCLKEWTIQYL